VNVIDTALILLLGATLTVAVAPRTKMPTDVLLLLGSLVLGLLPGLPRVSLHPEIVFILFLPPILFAAAYFTSWRDFKANIRPIALLAVGLVLFTSTAVALVAMALIPGMTWPVAFALGAIVSPPDASAATAITRKLGVPRRLVTLIEGESLVNDATALVVFRFALAAAMTGAFSLKVAALKFLWVGLGGVATGLFVGNAGIWLYRKIADTKAQILLSFLTAFGAYIFGELLGVSGVISTVTAGLWFGRCIPAIGTAQVRVEAQACWDLVLFVINAWVFALIGLQLPTVLEALQEYSPGWLAFQGLAVSAAVMAVRFLWIFPAAYLPRRLFPVLARRDPMPSWQSLVVLSWTGMRGIVSLAAALALPTVLPSGAAFPHRDLLIFLTYCVILTTLLIPALTLPALLRRLGLKADDARLREETRARIASVRAVLDQAGVLRGDGRYAAAHIDSLEKRYGHRLKILESNLTDQPYSPLVDEDQRLRRLLREVVRLEREALVGLRRGGEIHDEVFHLISRELDLEELRLRTERL